MKMRVVRLRVRKYGDRKENKRTYSTVSYYYYLFLHLLLTSLILIFEIQFKIMLKMAYERFKVGYWMVKMVLRGLENA